MIPAYMPSTELRNMDLKDYIDSTTISNTKDGVIDYINKYLERNSCDEQVKDFLDILLKNENLLNKTHIVSDGSLRSCVILVRPDGCIVTQSPHNYIIEDALKYFEQNSEIFFLNMTDITWSIMKERIRPHVPQWRYPHMIMNGMNIDES